MRLLKRRSELRDADFHFLALAFRRARVLHPFFLTAWVFLPDHWHAICVPVYPLTISVVMKSVRAGLVREPRDWTWSSVHQYSGMSADEQKRRCGLTIDRVRMPLDPDTRI